jgi:electron transport complex protein RnfE
MKISSLKISAVQTLWHENPSLVQLMGLCPLLAVSTSFVAALGLGLATLIIIITTNLISSILRHQLNPIIRVPVLMFIIATNVTALEMVMKANFYELFELLGIFVPLITVNYIVLSSAELNSREISFGRAAIDGFLMGLGFLLVLVMVGSIRELLGNGSLFNNMDVLFGSDAKDWVIHPFGDNFQFQLLLMPPGALIICGLAIATKNISSRKNKIKTS